MVSARQPPLIRTFGKSINASTYSAIFEKSNVGSRKRCTYDVSSFEAVNAIRIHSCELEFVKIHYDNDMKKQTRRKILFA